MKKAFFKFLDYTDARPFDWMATVVVAMLIFAFVPWAMERIAGRSGKQMHPITQAEAERACGINAGAVVLNPTTVQCYTHRGRKVGRAITVASAE